MISINNYITIEVYLVLYYSNTNYFNIKYNILGHTTKVVDKCVYFDCEITS